MHLQSGAKRYNQKLLFFRIYAARMRICAQSRVAGEHAAVNHTVAFHRERRKIGRSGGGRASDLGQQRIVYSRTVILGKGGLEKPRCAARHVVGRNKDFRERCM